MIRLIPNQPINFSLTDPDCFQIEQRPYCAKYNLDDIVYFQFRQTPCGSSAACNFANLITTNAVTNGDFDTDVSGWTQNFPGDFYFDGGKCHVDSAHTSAYILQTIAGVSVGDTVTITFTISNYISGGIYVFFGANVSGIYDSNGTYSITLTSVSNTNLVFSNAGGKTDLLLDNIRIGLTDSDCFIGSENVSITTEGATFLPGAISTLEAFYDIPATTYCRIHVTVSGMSSGVLTLSLTGVIDIGTITQNGTSDFYYSLPSGGSITFTTDEDFTGSILVDFSIDPLVNNYQCYALDENGTVVSTLSLLYDRDYIMHNNSAQSIFSSAGCYNIQLVDSCVDISDDLFTEINQDVEFVRDDLPPGGGTWWSSYVAYGGNTGGTMTVGSDKIHFSILNNGANNIGLATQRHTWVTGFYKIQYEVIMENIAPVSSGVRISLITPNGTSARRTILEPAATNGENITGEVYVYIDNSGSSSILDVGQAINLHNKFGIEIYVPNQFAVGNYYIESASFKVISLTDNPSVTGLYQSQCIDVQEDHECTRLVQGQYNTKFGLGFNWSFFSNPFKLSQRLKLCRFNPFYPIDGDDSKYSTGQRRTSYAEREKFYEFVFSQMSETEHDTISTQMLCKFFTINSVEYFSEPKDYKPLWDGKNFTGQTEGRLLASKQGTIINTNSNP